MWLGPWDPNFTTINRVVGSYGHKDPYSMFPIKRTVFFTSVTIHKNTVRLIGNIEYIAFIRAEAPPCFS